MINFPTIKVTVKADSLGDVSPSIRVGKNANEYNNASNFFTFLTRNAVDTQIYPNSGFHSIRCSPRDTPDYPVNDGARPLPSIESSIYGLDGRVLDILDNGTAAGTNVQMWDYTGAENQQWMLKDNGQIVNPHTGKCLDVFPTATNSPSYISGGSNGERVAINDCATTDQLRITDYAAQRWSVDDAVIDGRSAGGAIVNNAKAGKCLDVTDGESANGTRLQIWDCTGGPNQQFNFAPQA
ncbi:RICIN domain-containing protein [Rhodococcus marinonascens]|uniref:RICIN domain-containing protein n=1 Tax=Rhodococcus marinonascens TaxID=38311 RepID=UPI000A3FAF0B|nr:RICIN domain-containing protein [Rhodococcus marinonascens]